MYLKLDDIELLGDALILERGEVIRDGGIEPAWGDRPDERQMLAVVRKVAPDVPETFKPGTIVLISEGTRSSVRYLDNDGNEGDYIYTDVGAVRATVNDIPEGFKLRTLNQGSED